MKFRQIFGTNQLKACQLRNSLPMADFKDGYRKAQQLNISYPDIDIVIQVYENIAKEKDEINMFALGFAGYHRDFKHGRVKPA